MKFKIIAGIGFIILVLIISCQSDEQIKFERYYTAGSLTYQTHCQNCHGAKGEGLNALIPPLTDPVFLKSNKSILACAVKYGFDKKISIAGKPFQEKMPANDLPPIEIANVLTYVTNSFGNKMGTVDEQQVENSLAKCK